MNIVVYTFWSPLAARVFQGLSTLCFAVQVSAYKESQIAFSSISNFCQNFSKSKNLENFSKSKNLENFSKSKCALGGKNEINVYQKHAYRFLFPCMWSCVLLLESFFINYFAQCSSPAVTYAIVVVYRFPICHCGSVWFPQASTVVVGGINPCFW